MKIAAVREVFRIMFYICTDISSNAAVNSDVFDEGNEGRNEGNQARSMNQSVLRYWLDLGVDGFRVDAARHLYEADHFMDEPVIRETNGNDYTTLDHIYTSDQPENYELLKSWRSLLDEYAKKDGKTKILCTEDYNMPADLVRYLGNSSHPGVQIPLYVRTALINFQDNAYSIDLWIHNMTDIFPKESYNWALENHDSSRVSARYDPESVDSWNMLSLLLPGVASIYYGSEIGMLDIKTRPDQRQDPFSVDDRAEHSRDASRAPMPWDDTRNAGFTTAKKPWLPVNANYWRTNVKAQQKDPNSHLNTFKRLVELRKTPVIRHGDLHTYALKEWVYMFTRSLEGETIVVLMNIGSETEEVCAKNSAPMCPDNMFLHTGSANSGLKIGDKVKISDSDGTRCVQMRPHSGLVLSANDSILMSYSVLMLLIAVCSNVLW